MMDPGLSPNTWGARIDYDAWSDPAYVKDKVIVHWNGTTMTGYDLGVEREKSILRAVEKFHMDVRRWRGIAYGWAVGMSGTVYRLRGWNNYGAHTGDMEPDGVNENKEGIPVFFMVGEGQSPSQAMLGGFAELYGFLNAHPQSDLELEVYGHRDVSHTTCPGDEIYGLIQTPFWLPEGDDVMDPFYVELKKLVEDSGGSERSLFYALELLRGLATEFGVSANQPRAVAAAVKSSVTLGDSVDDVVAELVRRLGN